MRRPATTPSPRLAASRLATALLPSDDPFDSRGSDALALRARFEGRGAASGLVEEGESAWNARTPLSGDTPAQVSVEKLRARIRASSSHTRADRDLALFEFAETAQEIWDRILRWYPERNRSAIDAAADEVDLESPE